MKRLLLLLLACAGLWLAACSSSINASSTSLADQLIAPGGVSTLLDRPRIAAAIAELPNRHGFAAGRDGVPIFWRVFDPGDYGARYRYLPQRHENGLPLDTGLSLAVPQPFRAQAPRGTVVLLHGWMMNGDSMLPWSLQLAESGYRVVTLDLRGLSRCEPVGRAAGNAVGGGYRGGQGNGELERDAHGGTVGTPGRAFIDPDQ